MSGVAISKVDVDRARVTLAGMSKSLGKWLKYRQMNDDVASGKLRSSRLPQALAAQIAVGGRSAERELVLARQLHALLSELMPGSALPAPEDAGAAVALAKIAVVGSSPIAAGPTATGSINWTAWPILIVGGLLLAITSKIKSDADLEAEREHYACIKAGACTDYGFWLKAGGVLAVGWFAWTQMGVGHAVRKALKGGGE